MKKLLALTLVRPPPLQTQGRSNTFAANACLPKRFFANIPFLLFIINFTAKGPSHMYYYTHTVAVCAYQDIL